VGLFKKTAPVSLWQIGAVFLFTIHIKLSALTAIIFPEINGRSFFLRNFMR